MKTRFVAIFILFVSLFIKAGAQDIGLGQWRDHFPYNQCISIAIGDNKVYAATKNSLLYYDREDQVTHRKNKVNGLSDVGITSIAYSREFKTLVVAYSNTNIDLLKGDNVINIPDIKRKAILGNKTINKIFIIGKYAYLSCGFGIVVLDIDREEIRDSYMIGPLGTQINVNALTYNDSERKFYAATEKGIYVADSASNLAFYENWHKDGTIQSPDAKFNLIVTFNNRVYANSTKTTWSSDTLYVHDAGEWNYFNPASHSNRSSMVVANDKLLICNYLSVDVFRPDGSFEMNYYNYNPHPGEGGVVSVRPNDVCLDASNHAWIADNDKGMWEIDNSGVGHQYLINGPASSEVAAMDASGNTIWAVAGGRNASFGNLYKNAKMYEFDGSEWASYGSATDTVFDPVRDVLCVAVDPLDGRHAFMGSWGYNLFEFKDGQMIKKYTPSNSSLLPSEYDASLCYIGGVAYDNDHNLWVTNSTASNILSVRKSNGEWKSFNLGSAGTTVDVGSIIVDNTNQKWLQMRDLSLFVFNDNNTLDNTADDQVRKLTNAAGNGNLPGNNIASFAIDKEGQLWLGSDQGVAVIYSPENVFEGGNIDAQQVMVEEEGYLHPLLETEAVTAIAVNGDNEKWMGTDKSGVFKMSADGSKEIYHFSEENSPLLSNSITSIKIAKDGEVFFGTANGIVSFKDITIESAADLDSVYVFPNPVRENYTGKIAITNLVADSYVKITDVSGNLVWEINKPGGRVEWDGNDLDGRRVKTGVYLVLVTNPDGSKKKAVKVLFIN